MADGSTQLQESPPGTARATAPAPPVVLPNQDVRRRKPPALSFLLRRETLRHVCRYASLLALDFVGIFAAIFTALLFKEVVKHGEWTWAKSFDQAQDSVAFAYLLTVLLFARSGLYAERSQRPGLPKIVSSLFQVTVIALIYALIATDRSQYSSYYIFYGTFFFALVYSSSTRWAYEKVTGMLLRAAGYRRRAVLVGSGKHIEDVAHALRDEVNSPVEMLGFISLTPRPDNGLRSLGQIEELPEVLEEHGVQEVIIADPDFPQEICVELVDQCHQRGVHVRIAPSTMEILVQRGEFVPSGTVPLFELRPPVFQGFDYVLKRVFDFVGALLLVIALSPVLLLIAIAVWISSRGGILYRSIRPGVGGEPFACFKFRTMRSDADQLQADLESHNEATGPLFKIRDDPRMTPVGTVPAPLLARRAPAAVQRAGRPDVARRPAAAPAARLRAARGLAQEALPRDARHHRAVAGVGPLGPRLRRPRPARLPLPRAVVGRPGPQHPAADDPRGHRAARRVLN